MKSHGSSARLPIPLSLVVLCILLGGSVYSADVHLPPSGPSPMAVDAAEDAGGAGVAVPPVDLTLEAAVWMALHHNADLQVQAFEPLVAGTFLDLERARFATEFFMEASRRESRSSETARATGERFDAAVEQDRMTGGLRRTFSTGTDVVLSAGHVAETSNRAPGQDEARLSLTFTQSLLQGGGRQVNLAAVRRAQAGLDISSAELHGYTEAVVAEVESAYWRFWLAERTIAIAAQALDVAEKQLSDIRQRIEVGQFARNEEPVAQAEVSRRRQTLIDAQADLTRRRLELFLLIAPAALPGPLHPVTAPVMPAVDEDDTLEIRIQVAEVSRADLQEARLRLEQRRLDTYVTRNGLLPKLEIFAQLSKTGFGPDASESWSDMGGDSYDVQAGVRFQRSLGHRAESARDAAARFRRDQADMAVENLRQRIGAEVRIALNELERARRQIEASAETRRLQELTVTSEVERFQVGSGTALMVAQAQRDLLGSMIDEQRSLVQARQALLQLYLAEGSLLQRRGIRADAFP